MKVLHVAECVGGVDRYLKCLLKYSDCENIMILSQLYNENEYKKLAQCVEIMYMEHGIGLSAFKEAKVLRGKVKKYRPDIVYAHSSIAGAVARIACVGLDVKVVYNPHGWSFNMESSKKRIFIYLEKLMAHFCDAIVCISEAELVSALREKICKHNKLYVIENGIDIECCVTEDVSLPIPEDAFVVGMVGRICRQKAPDIFIKMAGEISKKLDNSYFVIVGDVLEGKASEKEEIEELARELEVNLYITGWVENPFPYMKMFDVGCLLSRWEGFGLAIPEYMLVGVPIVATKVDAIPYLITDGQDGYLVDKDDWLGAATKVIELANNRKLRREIIANEQNSLKRFDARRLARECEKLYKELVK